MSEKIGSALVVGGGIAGMQAALDLAESGIKVYLAEKDPCIGGIMSQLDKTFPTNDCAMCTMAPRLVEIGRHKDIELLTLAELEKIEGTPGNFKVTLKRKARYVNEEKCTGCGECVEKCPVDVLSGYNTYLSKERAIYRRYPQAIPNTFAINKVGHSPCHVACPAGQKAQAYIALIREKRYEDAYKTIIKDNPFPSVCGRICKHYCEEECTRQKVDEPVSIMMLKRFVSDWAFENNIKIKNGEELENKEEKSVAVIGSGPAGLTAAEDLSQKGYRVTVFEKLPVTGGMMSVGVPEFRLPSERLDWDIRNILSERIEVKTNHTVESIDDLFKKNYSAVFIAAGTGLGKKLPIPGSDLHGVLIGTDFLRAVALEEKVDIGGRVLVLGGGNVAVDVARTLIRFGAKSVQTSCLESKEKMPADSWEIEDAEDEGIVFFPARSFLKIITMDGRITGVKCVKVDFRGFDENGKLDMDIISGTEHIIEADTVIFAIGQAPDLSFIDGEIELTKGRTIKVDANTLRTSRAGVFAGGDVVSGTKFIVDAVAAGHRAAISIDLYLNGKDLSKLDHDIFQPDLYRVDLNNEEITDKIRSREKRQQIKKIDKEELKTFKEVQKGLDEEEALKEAGRCLNCSICSECLQCVITCGTDAIEHDMTQEYYTSLNVGAVILASGSKLVDPDLKKEYGYNRFPNVVSSLQFERILSPSGPYTGKILRPSDNKAPRRIAFIQCVGSRDSKNSYCSSICCMAATKAAVIAMEHEKNLECTIFFIDLRAHGKGFEDYYKRAREMSVRYIRSRPSSLKEEPKTGNLQIVYQNEDNDMREEVFGLVVLSIGFQEASGRNNYEDKLGIKFNNKDFCWTEQYEPVDTNREGIFASGTFTGPKDIPESILQASAASSKVIEMLADVRGSLIKPKEYPPERDTTGELPRIGVFICHCGKNIAGVVNVPDVRDYTTDLPDVVYAEDNLYTCSTDTALRIKKAIDEEKLNRVIVASCSPRTHEVLFQETLKESGLNPYFFEMANIRDQCSWAHMHEPEKATLKAKDLVRMAVAKARLLEPLYPEKMKVNQNALVIGGGIAGMNAALSFARFGVKTYLVERENELGGNFRRVLFSLNGEEPKKILQDLLKTVYDNKNIEIITACKVAEVNGSVGKFKSIIGKDEDLREIEHGIIVVATGAREYKPATGEYLYGEDNNVLTQLELEEKLSNDTQTFIHRVKTVVMIQCVGVRNENHSFCSRICCLQAVKNALKIKEFNPRVNVFILYRDIRTYGFFEIYYREAREKGVVFIRYEDNLKPDIFKHNSRIGVKIKDAVLKEDLLITADSVILSTGTIPNEENEEISKLLKISLSKDKFFLEKHLKLFPVDCATPGIFICGLAHYPTTIEESIMSAKAAAVSAFKIISKDERELEAKISCVLDENCDGCAYCIEPCPNDAVALLEYRYQNAIKKTVEVNSSLCEGCGVCMATCPKKGIYVKNFRPEQIMAQIEAALGV